MQLSANAPDFISPLMWPRNFPDLSSQSGRRWGVDSAAATRITYLIRDAGRLKQSLVERTMEPSQPAHRWLSDTTVGLTCMYAVHYEAATLSTKCNDTDLAFPRVQVFELLYLVNWVVSILVETYSVYVTSVVISVIKIILHSVQICCC